MKTYSFSHLSNPVLLSTAEALVARERGVTAELLAVLAEVDQRGLHVAQGYPSMFAYCVGALGLSEEAAFKRIRVARASPSVPHDPHGGWPTAGCT